MIVHRAVAGRRASDLCLPGNDFWVLDERLVRFHNSQERETSLTTISRMTRPWCSCAYRRSRPSGNVGSRTRNTGSLDRNRGGSRQTVVVAVSASSSAQHARQELATRLGEIRLDAGLEAHRGPRVGTRA